MLFLNRCLMLSALIGGLTCFADTTNAIAQETHRLQIHITSPLPFANTPLDPEIDFTALLRSKNISLHSVLLPDSIRVINTDTHKRVPHQLSPGFQYGDKGRVMWLVTKPSHTHYEIEFQTAQKKRSEKRATKSQTFPPIGVGDLLRYNASTPKPVTAFYGMTFADLNHDGNSDLIGCWNYAYGPDEPWNGLICYPGEASSKLANSSVMVRERTQLRFVSQGQNPQTATKKYFTQTYQSCALADFNQDGLLDLVQTTNSPKRAQIFLNTGQNEPNGFPIFEEAVSFPIQSWEACRAVDLDQDGTVEIIVNGVIYPNMNPKGWPYQVGTSIKLEAGKQPDFIDLDQDGLLDSVCLVGANSLLPMGATSLLPNGNRVAWRKNLGGESPKFGSPQLITDIPTKWDCYVTAVKKGEKAGLLVQQNMFQEISFYELTQEPNSTSPHFKKPQRIESNSAVLSLSDQAWPCVCDWEADGDLDLLIGGGYGWPRIVLNKGTNSEPQYDEPKLIQSNGKPIRFIRNELLGPPDSSHNMGYNYPNYVDWNGDNLPDLIFPNETNRIYWFANIGTRSQPKFGSQQQIVCEGFLDSPEMRTLSAQRSADKNSNNGVYPFEKERPYFWRTGAAFSDWNNDGRMDFITLSGATKQATLFVQIKKENQSEFQVRKAGFMKLTDGRPIDDSIVKRRSHWTESFRPVDWNQDGLTDLVYSLAGSHGGIKDNGSIYLLLNEGTKERPVFAPPITLSCYGKPIRLTAHGPHPWVGDFDGDGQPDLLACVEWSVYPFYRHAALQMKTRPKLEIKLLD
jgi:FG-GAP-like repeat